ncbi:MAG: DUF4301 family protein [Bacteroidota bacterium]
MADLTEKDIKQLQGKGISKAKVMDQIATFKAGIPFVSLKRAAVVGDGIIGVETTAQQDLISFFETHATQFKLLKFVPASGAASRMFKAMFNFLEAYNPKDETFTDYVARTKDDAASQFKEQLAHFPFYEMLSNRIAGTYASEGEKIHAFVKEMLVEEGLNFGFYPKGLLPFHRYETLAVTPFEEHLKEAALYAKANGTAHLHFTISPQHTDLFDNESENVTPRIAGNTNTEFHITYSNQKASTDTLAVYPDNTPFRNDDGTLLFRPGGHGALIENLDEQDADIIFIKNIDNVVVERDLETVAQSKKVLGGMLMKVQEKAFRYRKDLEEEKEVDYLEVIADFVQNELNSILPKDFETLTITEKSDVLKARLNRPIRICGMVRNEGDPGGGPFWITDSQGNESLQIIESAQIDRSNPQQESILKGATHFNPVDLVCGIKNYKGEKYNLLDFVDAKQGFITGKTKAGKELKALELPGLWNGAMAFWNTIFVEVPTVTFNPVKTVNDLLKPSHQV